MLLVVGVLLSPQRASATECGSHVTVLNPTAESQHAPMSHGDPAKAPCQGPNCSSAPERNAPPPASAPISGQIKQSIPGTGQVNSADPPHVSFDRSAEDARPIYRSLSIFHPPRAA